MQNTMLWCLLLGLTPTANLNTLLALHSVHKGPRSLMTHYRAPQGNARVSSIEQGGLLLAYTTHPVLACRRWF